MLNVDPFALILLFVGMSLLPFVAMVSTCYLKIVVVMSLIRNALGVQSIPPNMVINALALILTFYVMSPIASQSWDLLQEGLRNNKPEVIYKTDLASRAAEPFREFLRKNTADQPSFCVSELTRAFQIGFLVYLPFIAIDIIVSNILLAMGMMMVSPVTISLPFKLLLFVMVNGWARLIQGLVQSYVQ